MQHALIIKKFEAKSIYLLYLKSQPRESRGESVHETIFVAVVNNIDEEEIARQQKKEGQDF